MKLFTHNKHLQILSFKRIFIINKILGLVKPLCSSLNTICGLEVLSLFVLGYNLIFTIACIHPQIGLNY